MPMHHHHHENKRDKAKTRALQSVIRNKEKGIVLEDKPIALIDIGLKNIEQLINEKIPEQYEDARQDAWLAILQRNPTSNNDILAIIKEIISLRKDDFHRRKNMIYLDAPIKLKSSIQGELSEQSLKDIMVGDSDGSNCNYKASSIMRSKDSLKYKRKSQRNPISIPCTRCGNIAILKSNSVIWPLYCCQKCNYEFYPTHEYKKKYTNEVRKLVIDLRRKEHTYREIQNILLNEYGLHLSLGGINNWCRGTKDGWTPTSIRRIKERLRDGKWYKSKQLQMKSLSAILAKNY